MMFQASDKHNLTLYKQRLCQLFQRVVLLLHEHNVPFVSVFGTCLGAIRHRGMIPWDDDIDIAVERSEYHHLVSILKQYCPDLYVWNWHDDPDCCLPYVRLFYRVHDGMSIEDYRAYLDVFIIDGASRFDLIRHCESTVLRAIVAVMKCKSKYGGGHYFAFAWSPTSIVRICLLPLFLVPKKLLVWLYEKIVGLFSRGKYRVQEADEYGCNTTCPLPIDLLRDVKLVRFEGFEIPVPARAEEYLQYMYGDWKTPPPENARMGLAWDASGSWRVPGPYDEIRRMKI